MNIDEEMLKKKHQQSKFKNILKGLLTTTMWDFFQGGKESSIPVNQSVQYATLTKTIKTMIITIDAKK